MDPSTQGESLISGVFRRLSLSGPSWTRRESLGVPLPTLFDRTGEGNSGNVKYFAESLCHFLNRVLSPDPRLYQEFRERGLNSNNQESDDDLLDDNSVQVEQPITGESIVVKNYRPTQLIWSQLPQVQEKGILNWITPEERKRQEAIFEIITSEYSYQHSLDILFRLFKKSDELKQTITSTDHHHLFSNIADILEVSKR
ncbi:hypothetical protein FKM82_024883 [Ascaphus truei]